MRGGRRGVRGGGGRSPGRAGGTALPRPRPRGGGGGGARGPGAPPPPPPKSARRAPPRGPPGGPRGAGWGGDPREALTGTSSCPAGFSGAARQRCRVPRRYPAAAAPPRGSRPPFPGRYLRPWGAATEVRGRRFRVRQWFRGSAMPSGGSPTEVPFLPPLSCGGGTGAREPPPFPRRYLRPWGAATEFRGSFWPDDHSRDGHWTGDCSSGGCSRRAGVRPLRPASAPSALPSPRPVPFSSVSGVADLFSTRSVPFRPSI
jgi:hypothetical protein